ncbi:stimulated by retinoic acid gene 6 protein-like [Amphiura filiformis]|uniref:stimulated by retinoic acid gene 6 protein-like n=1 Tax=Amphiura filiformis TaxID=82378 RepID=UPI003B227133
MTVSDKISEWLPGEAEHWSPDELREYVLESNVSTSFLGQLLDYFNYEDDDLEIDDFWMTLQDTVYGQDTNTTYGCDNPKFNLIDWVEWSLLPSFFIIGIFAFTSPRKRLWPNCCSQRPSIAFPVNLIDEFEESWMFACGFAIMTTSILDLFTGNFYYDPDISHLPSMLQGTIWGLIVVLNVLQVSFAYYPILLCLTNIKKHPAKANGIGLAYTAIWTYYYVYRMYECPLDEGLIGAVNTAMLAPIYLCYLILNGRFILGIYHIAKGYLDKLDGQQVVKKPKNKLGMSDAFRKTHYYERVKFLLQKPSEEPPEEKSLSVRLREKVYPLHTGFKYSRRMVCTSVLAGLALYELGLFYLLAVGQSLVSLKDIFRDGGYLDEIFELANATEQFEDFQFTVKVLDDTFWPTTYIAMTIMAVFGIHMHWCYRIHTLQMWRGDRSFCPAEKFAFSTKVVASLRFSGYHVGFSLWGALLLQIVMWFLAFFCVAVIINPWINGESNVIIELIENYWLATLLSLVFYYGQVLYARLVFLIGKGDVLGLDNRRNFHVTVYVTLFLNAILGLASCLMRILKAVMFGMLFIGRVDRCTLMRGFELWDPGFKAYIGFMELEVAHTHPVMVTFVHILWEAIKQRKSKEALNQSCTDLDDFTADGCLVLNKTLKECPDKTEEQLRKIRARNRWFVAITLMNNRQLSEKRQTVLPELEAIRAESRLEKAQEKLVKDDVENLQGALVGAAAGLIAFVFRSDKNKNSTPTTDVEAVEAKIIDSVKDDEDNEKENDDDIMPGQVSESS